MESPVSSKSSLKGVCKSEKDFLAEIPEGKEQEYKELIKLNLVAYNDLINCFRQKTQASRIALNIVVRSTCEKGGGGNAYLAWKRLNDKYLPSTAATVAKLQSNLFNLKCKARQDPEEYINAMCDLRDRIQEAGGEIGRAHV